MVCLRYASVSLLNANDSSVSDCEEIYSRDRLVTWVGRPSLKFYEDSIFSLSTLFLRTIGPGTRHKCTYNMLLMSSLHWSKTHKTEPILGLQIM